MRAANEKGIALVMVLILMGVLSTLAASLIFVSQTETWSSQNYRLMTEARYAAESGVHRAANFLMYSYVPPAPTGGDPLSGYTITGSPVVSVANSQAVTLRSFGGSNYPVSSVVTAFTTAAHGTIGGATDVINYDAEARLTSMRQVTVFGSTTPVTVQTWQIVGRGTIPGARGATVDVSATLERQVLITFNYAAFATDNGCGALSWSGGGSTDSYDSTQLVGGNPVFANNNGNVGTNGNLDENGGPTVIYGSLSTPRSGVGACSTGAVTALTMSGSQPPTDGLVELPQPINYPTPTPPTPAPTGNITVNNGATVTFDPASTDPNLRTTHGDVVVKGNLHMKPGTYNVNSLTLNAGGNLFVDPGGPVILNVAGYNTPGNAASGYMTSPIDFTGQSVTTNTALNPSMFQILYAGTGNIKMAGGADTAGLLYAPNATVQNNSAGAQWFGAVIARRVTDAGHAVIHYDRHLQKEFMMVGPWMMDSFTWGRF
jgi:hypothetical protein